MELKTLQNEMIAAMKAHDKERKDAISSLVSAAKKAAIDQGCREDVPDSLVDQVIMKELKTVKEQIDSCPAERTDLIESYQKRFDVIKEFAPEMMDEEQVRAYILEKYPEEAASKNKGLIMKTVMSTLKGKAEGKVISAVVDSLCKQAREKYMKKVEDYVRSIPDFPEKGIIFRDVTSVLQDADGLALAIDEMTALLEGIDFDVIVGAESRGFIFGAPMAYKLHKPLVLCRKKGKLPCETISMDYDLEYGSATVEMHKDSIKPGQKVVIVDDLIATGGTVEATCKLVEALGGEVVSLVFLMELAGLKGRERLSKYDVKSVICYPGKQKLT